MLARGAKGVTVADVAQRAYVGKGTVYLYWSSKEELLLGLIGREFLAVAETLTAELTRDPENAQPPRFCSLAIRMMDARPLVAALQAHNIAVLGVLADHPLAASIYDALGPITMLRAVVPIWRNCGLARTDWDERDQVLALHILVVGVITASAESLPIEPAADPMSVFTRSISALLGTADTGSDQLRTAADAIKTFLSNGSARVLELISMPAEHEAPNGRPADRS